VTLDPDRILALLKDPNVDSQEVAAAAGTSREEAAARRPPRRPGW
jgi:hypothetical protein